MQTKGHKNYKRKTSVRSCTPICELSAKIRCFKDDALLKGGSAYKIMKENPWTRKEHYRGGHFRARRYLAVSSGSITDEIIKQYIDEQEGEEIEGKFELE